MTNSFTPQELSAPLIAHFEKSGLNERNAIPFLIKNNTMCDLQIGGGNVAKPGDVIAVQPNGSIHVTNIELHEKGTGKNGIITSKWQGKDFFRFNLESLQDAIKDAGTPDVRYTELHLADEAVKFILKNNEVLLDDEIKELVSSKNVMVTQAEENKVQHLEAAKVEAIKKKGLSIKGWCPSISLVIAVEMAPDLDGMVIKQSWGDQVLDSKTQVLFITSGKGAPDVYGNDIADTNLWFTEGHVGEMGHSVQEKLARKRLPVLSKDTLLKLVSEEKKLAELQQPVTKLTHTEAIKFFFSQKLLPQRLGQILSRKFIHKDELDKALGEVGGHLKENVKDIGKGLSFKVDPNDFHQLTEEIANKIILDIKTKTKKFQDKHRITFTTYADFVNKPAIDRHLKNYTNDLSELKEAYRPHDIKPLQKNLTAAIHKSLAVPVGVYLFNTDNPEKISQNFDKAHDLFSQQNTPVIKF